MVKFSIVVPIYNVYNYLEDCLESLKNQSYENFEVILVNDGSPDDSQKIIDKYVSLDKRFTGYKKKNGGLSDARNYGVTKTTGDYLLFVDSDDTVNKDLLFKLNEEIEQNGEADIIKFGLSQVNINNEEIQKSKLFEFHGKIGEKIFEEMITDSFFVTAVLYAYRRKFWIQNKFTYANGRIHEDFGLTPYVVIKAKNVSSIEFIGYNYYIRDNSIMTSNSKEKLKKKNEDCLYHFDTLLKWINEDDNVSFESKKVFRSYIANALIVRCKDLDNELLNDYLNELKIRKISKYLIDNTLMRKCKKIVFKIFPKLYIKYFLK